MTPYAGMTDAELHRQFLDAAASAEIAIYGKDTLCRFLAILLVYGGEEFALDRRLHDIAMLGGQMIYKACADGDAVIIAAFQGYYREIVELRAPWLPDFARQYGIRLSR
jgi:DNA-binding MurR/RpiR family transcriptional regulator